MSSISVVFPAYNNGEYIAAALRSVLGHPHPADEIVVIDDGSSDHTEHVVHSLQESRIRYFWQENSGVLTSRNRGLDIATGNYVSFLDADDRWGKNALEVQHRLMQSDPRLICCFANFVRFEDALGTLLGDQFREYPELASARKQRIGNQRGWILDGDAFESAVAFGEFPAYTQTMMFRASELRGICFNEHLSRCEDAEFVLRVFLRGNVAFTDEILAEVRRHANNATRDISLIPLDQLRSLECVNEDPAARNFEQVLASRIMRARLDAAAALLKYGDRSDAIRLWGKALGSSGPILLPVMHSLGRRPAARQRSTLIIPSKLSSMSVFEKKALVTITVGDYAIRMARATQPLMREYASRCEADFLVITQPKFEHLGQLYYEKFQLYEFLQSYDRVLYVDNDVLIAPDSPNLFLMTPLDHFGASSEESWTKCADCKRAICDELGSTNWTHPYFNAGVMLASRNHREIFDPDQPGLKLWATETVRKKYEYQGDDQTYFNYRLNDLRLPMVDHGYRFNHTRAIERTQSRFRSFFIHYAGTSGHRYGSRIEQIEKDARVLQNPFLLALSRRSLTYRWIADLFDFGFLRYLFGERLRRFNL
jgi:glycosyltransferase involved in cell wall biosynthesis